MIKRTIIRAANARGLDRPALVTAKRKVGMVTVESSLNLPDAEREKRLTQGLSLLSEASNLQRESSRLIARAFKMSAAKK